MGLRWKRCHEQLKLTKYAMIVQILTEFFFIDNLFKNKKSFNRYLMRPKYIFYLLW